MIKIIEAPLVNAEGTVIGWAELKFGTGLNYEFSKWLPERDKEPYFWAIKSSAVKNLQNAENK
jgi:hypothetical protein